MAPRVAVGAPWLSSTASQIQPSVLSKSLSLKMASPNQHRHNAKQIGFQFQEQDSSSTQSTGQSYHEAASVGESNGCGQSIISMQSGILCPFSIFSIFIFMKKWLYICNLEVHWKLGK